MYKFDSHSFADDTRYAIESMGWDEFKTKARTNDRVIVRALKWEKGTIGIGTFLKICNVMRHKPEKYIIKVDGRRYRK